MIGGRFHKCEIKSREWKRVKKKEEDRRTEDGEEERRRQRKNSSLRAETGFIDRPFHPMTIRCQLRIHNFCKITYLWRRGTIPRAARIVAFDEERKIVHEKNISGNYLQDEQLGRERKLSGLLSVTTIGRFKEKAEELRMRIR